LIDADTCVHISVR